MAVIWLDQLNRQLSFVIIYGYSYFCFTASTEIRDILSKYPWNCMLVYTPGCLEQGQRCLNWKHDQSREKWERGTKVLLQPLLLLFFFVLFLFVGWYFFLLLLCFIFFSDCLSPGANLCKNLGSFLCVCSVISGWEQVLSWYFKILEDRMIVKVQMFAEIRKNKLDFCLKCN